MDIQRTPINLLPEALQNQIAAGEVVERPANVVKELIENSIDAKATTINVTIENGGQTLIKVQDDGIGIPRSELKLALTRHATNKITSMDDLWRIHSFGFRGEALPSIASVSSFKIESAFSKENKIEAAFLQIEHGKVEKEGLTALYKGTIITVQDLFTTLPARLKFLKAPATEQKRIQEFFTKIALVNNVEMTLSTGIRELFKFSIGESIEQRLNIIWPESITSQLSPFDKKLYGIRVYGFTSPPKQTQPRADKIFLYVNNRIVNDKLILRAIRDAYKGKLLSNEYPQTILLIDIPPEQIDVNVHPTKTEVRFREEKTVFSAIITTLKETLVSIIPQISFDNIGINPSSNNFWGNADQQRILPIMQQDKNQPEIKNINTTTLPPLSNPLFITETPSIKEFSDTEKLYTTQKITPLTYQGQNSKQIFINTEDTIDTLNKSVVPLLPTANVIQNKEQTNIGPYTYLGQLGGTYLILIDTRIKNSESLILLDQHAVHERILLMKIQEKSIAKLAQNLVLPIQLTLHPTEQEQLQNTRETLFSLGFHFSTQSTYLNIQAIPHLLDRNTATVFLKKVLSGQEENFIKLWVSMACKAALKSNTILTPSEAATLIKQWIETEEKEYCPHGRPCFIVWSTHELDILFKRR